MQYNLTMRNRIRLLSTLSFLEGLIAFLWLASLPASGGVYSPFRLASLLGILVVSAGWMYLYFQKDIADRAIQRLLTWKGRLIFAGLSIFISLLALSTAAQRDVWSPYIGDAAFARLTPILVWGSVLSVQIGLILLFAETEYDQFRLSIHPPWKPTVILLACFLIIWAFISVTKIGITSDIVGLSWGPPGTPITFGQALSVFMAGMGLAIFHLLIGARWIRSGWILDALIFLGLWALTAFLWRGQPMIPSHFAPEPMPPNFEYYPNSDAAIFDKSSYELLYGAGFDAQLIRRPVYVGLLAVFHRIAGPSYEGTIFLQILFLAFIPALVYLLAAGLSNRLAGLLAGGLIALREANAIRLSGEIVASHAKLMMSDLATMLGVAVILYISITLLAKRERNSWTLAILGACIGLTILVRAQTLIVLPVVLLFFIVNRKPVKTGLREALIVFLGLALILAPWVWRNWNLTGTFVLDDRGEERLLARNYSTNPTALPLPMENESEREFSARLKKEIFDYAAAHLADVLFFVSNHFFHNLMNGVIYIAPIYSNESPEGLLNRVPYWGTWDGRVAASNSAFLLINLAIVALGAALAGREYKLAGWLPLIIFIVYSGGNALVRSSGWRFSLPVDWIILMYYCLALAYAPSKIGALFYRGAAPGSNPKEESRVKRSYLPPVIFSLLFIAGAAVPLAERMIPTHDFSTPTAQASETLAASQILPRAELDAFLQQDDAVLLSGVALYPRYFRPNSRIHLADAPETFTYLHFWLIGSDDDQIVLPLQNVPGGVPHTTAVSVLGCKTEGYISAWAVIVHSRPGQILIRDPQPPLSCPLTEPN